eukprot:CAMPEP_0180655094 /NCGR_PEP_ID=MMETSP1037_2-20121125/55080_1 /TAXON_ID=632150 /ORGANISM="Azadinium spinosum, Strain 3D9" /LENGTH=45 /DNA_ID= /DNA_START= /DNA_END= /DNA_ORIENTATION=
MPALPREQVHGTELPVSFDGGCTMVGAFPSGWVVVLSVEGQDRED